nr:pentatricopeptide repeat-containing protein At4g16390, chloroplastic-like [Malus domestica]
MGHIAYFLGIQITYKSNGDLFINQGKYAKDLIHKAGMVDCKNCYTPCKPHNQVLTSDGSLLSDSTLYRSLLGGLQYLTFTRPNIAFAVNTMCQYMSAPTDVHFARVKRILRYLQGTVHCGLTYISGGSLFVNAYSDSDWVADLNTRRSITSYVVFLGNNPISWQSKKQSSVSRSSIEAEYRALAHTTAYIAWIRKGKDMERSEKLFDEILQRGVNPDNVTFSTMISCFGMCSLLDKAVEWFEKMPGFGCNLDNVTYLAMIDAYGRAGKVEMAFSLYDRARTEKWHIDPVTFSTLIKIHEQSRNFDGCLNVYEELKAIGAKPNLVIYNTLLDAMGRARRPWQAKKIYREMISNELSPNWVTYASLLRAYGRAHYRDDALNVYKEMKEKGLELNVILYNTLLAMCADVGYTDEAVDIFEEMKSSETLKPDSWTFSSMITIYSCSVESHRGRNNIE